MLKPIVWKTFPRDFMITQLGFIFYGASIALMIQAELGTGPWAVLSVAMADLFGTSPGIMIVVTGVFILAIAMAMKEKVGWGTLGNILFVGPWVDFFLLFIPSYKGNLYLQIPIMLLAILLTGLATAIYISVEAGAGPRDSLMLAASRVSGQSVRLSRTIIEIIVVILGWQLGGPVGYGTLAFAVLIGPSVQLFFKLLNVQPNRSTVES